MKQLVIAVLGGFLCLAVVTFSPPAAVAHDHFASHHAKMFKAEQMFNDTVFMAYEIVDSLRFSDYVFEQPANGNAPAAIDLKTVTHGFYAYQRHVREKPRICLSRGTAIVIS